MQDLYRQYKDRASFLTIYVKEAHPTDEWQMDSNEEEGVCYPQPVTLDDRVAIARDFVESCAYEIPIAIDPVDNPADQIYAGWPERFYIVDVDGTIAYKGETGPFGYHPEAVAGWLKARFPPVVLRPSDVGADRIAQEPLAVRAVEHSDGRESWRLVIDFSKRATIGRGSDAESYQLDADRDRALRQAIADRGFFAWKECSGTPNIEALTRSITVELGTDRKIVHRYSFAEDEDDGGEPRDDESSPEVAGFEAIWDLLRGFDTD